MAHYLLLQAEERYVAIRVEDDGRRKELADLPDRDDALIEILLDSGVSYDLLNYEGEQNRNSFDDWKDTHLK